MSASRLAELNQYVPIHVFNGILSLENLCEYAVVVVTETPLERQLEWSDYCHQNGTKFISSEIRGLFGYIFCDFGDEFTVHDTTGENPLSGIISNITKDTEGIVTCIDDTRHGLEDGDFVTFSEVKGMDELNGITPRKVKVIGPYSFSIGDTCQFNNYISGGIYSQVKMAKKLKFVSILIFLLIIRNLCVNLWKILTC